MTKPLSTIALNFANSVLTITPNRPEPLNAFNSAWGVEHGAASLEQRSPHFTSE
jgi:hypothetical protein